MGNAYRIVALLALVAVAALLHSFYVDYRLNAPSYLISWNSPRGLHQAFVEAVAKNMVRPERQVRRHNPRAGEGFPAYRDNPDNGCRLVREGYGPEAPTWMRQAFLDHHANYRCRKPWPKTTFYFETIPAVGYEEALAKANAAHPTSKYGMAPSRSSAGDEPSRSAAAKSMWLGIILPALMLFGALALLISIVHSSRRSPAPSQRPVREKVLGGMAFENDTLSKRLRSKFGPDLGVAGGDATRSNPLVITDKLDYVSIEYAVAKFLMEGKEWRKKRQALLDIGGRYVDELVFEVREPEGEWQEQSFYFDITSGYQRQK